MAGLTREGFTPLSLEEIKENIKGRLRAFSSNMDLSVESPDGQLVEIFSFEISQLWNELNRVYNSYNPDIAEGAALRNLGLISGLPYGAATRSQADVVLDGYVPGTLIPAGSLVADSDGNEFATTYDVRIQTFPLQTVVQVVAVVSGNINVDPNSINTVVTNISGWNSVAQPNAGRVGGAAQTDIQYRNLRNRTVLRNASSVVEKLRARIIENLGVDQVRITNNDSLAVFADGTPPNHIHIVLGETDSNLTAKEIARVIYNYKGLGTLTYGNETEAFKDTQDAWHNVSFTRAEPVAIQINLEVDFLDDDYAGAEESIKEDLPAGQNIIWSRLFGIITPYSRADVLVLELAKISNGVAGALSPSSVVIGQDEYASIDIANINFSRA